MAADEVIHVLTATDSMVTIWQYTTDTKRAQICMHAYHRLTVLSFRLDCGITHKKE
jgi:hypothetical protein